MKLSLASTNLLKGNKTMKTATFTLINDKNYSVFDMMVVLLNTVSHEVYFPNIISIKPTYITNTLTLEVLYDVSSI